jgi:flagellar hook-length control protein FliK
MSIERSSTASSPKAATGVEGQSNKNKVKSGAESDGSAASGFSAILTSLESPSPPAPSEAADTELTADEKEQKAVAPPSDPLILPPPILPTDLALLLAQAGEAAGAKSNLVSSELPVGVKGGHRLDGAALGADKPELAITASTPLDSDKTAEAKHSVKAMLDQMTQGVSAQAHKVHSAELQADMAAKLADSRATKLSSLLDAAAREPALSGALVTSGMGDSLLRQADRSASKLSGLFAGSGVEGLGGQQVLQGGSRLDSPAVMADPATVPLETTVAETVSYWVTQGVQNAQLKLDGFGGTPVEVSISLKGDEAHIDFRTDQPEIRQILEGAVAQLKDLLTSEGLVLSGVSVGSSGQDGAGAQEQRNRPGTRQATITTPDVVPAESRQRVNPSVGRAVDLFV